VAVFFLWAPYVAHMRNTPEGANTATGTEHGVAFQAVRDRCSWPQSGTEARVLIRFASVIGYLAAASVLYRASVFDQRTLADARARRPDQTLW